MQPQHANRVCEPNDMFNLKTALQQALQSNDKIVMFFFDPDCDGAVSAMMLKNYALTVSGQHDTSRVRLINFPPCEAGRLSEDGKGPLNDLIQQETLVRVVVFLDSLPTNNDWFHRETPCMPNSIEVLPETLSTSDEISVFVFDEHDRMHPLPEKPGFYFRYKAHKQMTTDALTNKMTMPLATVGLLWQLIACGDPKAAECMMQANWDKLAAIVNYSDTGYKVLCAKDEDTWQYCKNPNIIPYIQLHLDTQETLGVLELLYIEELGTKSCAVSAKNSIKAALEEIGMDRSIDKCLDEWNPPLILDVRFVPSNEDTNVQAARTYFMQHVYTAFVEPELLNVWQEHVNGGRLSSQFNVTCDPYDQGVSTLLVVDTSEYNAAGCSFQDNILPLHMAMCERSTGDFTHSLTPEACAELECALGTELPQGPIFVMYIEGMEKQTSASFRKFGAREAKCNLASQLFLGNGSPFAAGCPPTVFAYKTGPRTCAIKCIDCLVPPDMNKAH